LNDERQIVWRLLYNVHTDHLNTPRLIANQTGQAVWRWDNTDPFGGNPPDENPSGLGNFTCNLRLPGQYFDRETNTHYNYFRDYDPGIGRYIQSDPIGLRGGINTYAYAGSNPLSNTDPTGEFVPLVVAGAFVGAGISTAVTVAAAISQGQTITTGMIAGAVVSGAIAGGVGTVATPLAGALGLGTRLFGTAVVNAGAGAIGTVASNVLSCQPASANVGLGAAFGAFGGYAGARLFPTRGMNAFGQIGFPRTWPAIVPIWLGGNAGPNAINAIYTGGSVSAFVGAAGPVGASNVAP
jgi:RHS repeat-associated protein